MPDVTLGHRFFGQVVLLWSSTQCRQDLIPSSHRPVLQYVASSGIAIQKLVDAQKGYYLLGSDKAVQLSLPVGFVWNDG